MRFLVFLGSSAVLAGLVYLGLIISFCHEILIEFAYWNRFGADWKTHYEQTLGPLSQGRSHMVVAAFGIAGLTAAGMLLIRGLKNGRENQSSYEHSESRTERRVRYKRNALLGIYFGVPAILFSVLLAVFRMGIFEEHSNEVSLAIFIFLGGYGAVVGGCYWWLKAKHWTESVLIIAFMPLIVFFIPFVRLLVLKVLGLLVAAMVMAPLILVAVVAALPDKSDHSRSRAPWERRRRRREHSRS